MNILISRILTYLNGTLMFDEYYLFCLYVVNHYRYFEDIELSDIVADQKISKESILAFCDLLGFSSFEQFKQTLLQDYTLRTDQIHARMLGTNSEDIINKMETSLSKEELQAFVSKLCKVLYEVKRIILIGPLYPISIAVEFQTDFITFGKPVIQYHHFDQQIRVNEDDIIIYISATGRSMGDFKIINEKTNAEKAKSLLITQNKIFTEGEHKPGSHVLHIPGKFDGIHFYHQIMFLFDAIRIQYYQQFYL
ncbi:MAG: MurR/RpiR family transcriptional regulator [Coprobacillaceae bacterium]